MLESLKILSLSVTQIWKIRRNAECVTPYLLYLESLERIKHIMRKASMYFFFGPAGKIVSMTNPAHDKHFYWLKTPPAPSIVPGSRYIVWTVPAALADSCSISGPSWCADFSLAFFKEVGPSFPESNLDHPRTGLPPGPAWSGVSPELYSSA